MCPARENCAVEVLKGMKNLEERVDSKQRLFFAKHEENKGIFEAT